MAIGPTGTDWSGGECVFSRLLELPRLCGGCVTRFERVVSRPPPASLATRGPIRWPVSRWRWRFGAVRTSRRAMSDLGYRTFAIGKFHTAPRNEDLGYKTFLRSEETHNPTTRKEDGYAAWLRREHPEFDFFEQPMGERTEMYYIPQRSPLPAELGVESWAADCAVEQIERRGDSRPILWFRFLRRTASTHRTSRFRSIGCTIQIECRTRSWVRSNRIIWMKRFPTCAASFGRTRLMTRWREQSKHDTTVKFHTSIRVWEGFSTEIEAGRPRIR